MDKIKVIYNEIDSWLKKQDPKKIKFLQEQSCYDNNSELGKLKETLRYHDVINDSKSQKKYLFGEEKVTLKDIKDHMLNSMGDYGPKKGESQEDFNEDCLSSGYADSRMFKEIKDFWKNLNNDSLLSVASGSIEDDYEINLDGHRCYFLSRSKVQPLIFNYIYYTLKKTTQELDEELFNSNDSFDEIIGYFPPENLYLPNADVIDKLYGGKASEYTEKNINDFSSFIKNILSNERLQNEPELKEKMEQLKQLI